MATYVLSKDDSVPVKLALSSLQDFLGEEGLATVVSLESTPWATEVISTLGLGSTKSLPKLTHLDTVIGPEDEELVYTASRAGATYLNIAEGLVPLEFEVEAEVPESPDLDNIPDLPEPKDPEPVVEAKPPAPRKKRKPLPEVPAPVVQEDVDLSDDEVVVAEAIIDKVEEVTESLHQDKPIDEADLLINLINLKVEEARNDTARLWAITDLIRGV